MIKLTDKLILERKLAYDWFMEEKYKDGSSYEHEDKKCDCGHDYTKLINKDADKQNSFGYTPYRHSVRFVDFKNKIADICASCGRELEFIDARENAREYSKDRDITINHRDILLNQIKEYDELLLRINEF